MLSSNISNVTTDTQGGAFYVFNNSELYLENVTATEADAGDEGGCIYAYASVINLRNFTCD